jgi:hypothetical protein
MRRTHSWRCPSAQAMVSALILAAFAQPDIGNERHRTNFVALHVSIFHAFCQYETCRWTDRDSRFMLTCILFLAVGRLAMRRLYAREIHNAAATAFVRASAPSPRRGTAALISASTHVHVGDLDHTFGRCCRAKCGKSFIV